jgi:hypothetical protein
MPAEHEPDPVDRWLNQQVQPLPPPPGTFELIARRARRRKVRKVAVSAVSAAAVVVAVAVGVPLGLRLNLTPSTKAGLASGSSAAPSGTAQGGSGHGEGTGSAASHPAPAATGPAAGGSAGGGYLPPAFQPTSVTWDSTSDGWVIGPAGTPGHCANANPFICTSVARTDDGGQTWHGLPAPDAGSPDGAAGVSGIRFLDGKNGWAFGPELWVTHDAGKSWTAVSTGGQRVTDLETAGTRAYALFARCGGTSSASFARGCTSYTLMTATAGGGQWTPAGSATTGLTSQGAATSGMIALYGSTGYLAAPDGTLYSGPPGGSWQKAGALPCQPGAALASGLPAQAQIALLSPTGLATYCAGGTGAPKVYQSADSGATWTLAGQWPSAAATAPASVAATSAGTLLLAAGNGIWLLRGQTWEKAAVTGTAEPAGGFSYVGMTSTAQGVALPADASLHAVFMTTDGGVSWQARPIKSS